MVNENGIARARSKALDETHLLRWTHDDVRVVRGSLFAPRSRVINASSRLATPCELQSLLTCMGGVAGLPTMRMRLIRLSMKPLLALAEDEAPVWVSRWRAPEAAQAAAVLLLVPCCRGLRTHVRTHVRRMSPLSMARASHSSVPKSSARCSPTPRAPMASRRPSSLTSSVGVVVLRLGADTSFSACHLSARSLVGCYSTGSSWASLVVGRSAFAALRAAHRHRAWQTVEWPHMTIDDRVVGFAWGRGGCVDETNSY